MMFMQPKQRFYQEKKKTNEFLSKHWQLSLTPGINQRAFLLFLPQFLLFFILNHRL